MNIFKEAVLPLFGILFAVLCVAGVMTGISLFDMSNDCDRDGGTFSIEGGTAWCRY